MPGTILVGGSTADVGPARPLHEAAPQVGSRFAGAPAADGTGGAEAGVAATSPCDPAPEDVLRVVAADRTGTGTGLDADRPATSTDQRLGDAGAGSRNCSAVVKGTDGSIESEERN